MITTICTMAQYTAYIGGDDIKLYAPASTDSRKPDLYDVKWSYSGSGSVTFISSTSNPTYVRGTSTGSGRITCYARYYNKAKWTDPLYTGYTSKTESYTITIIDPNAGGGGGGTGGGDDPDPDPDPSYLGFAENTIEGIPMYFWITTIDGEQCAAVIPGPDDSQSIPYSCTKATIPETVRGYPVRSITYHAFGYHGNLEEIVFPSTLRYVHYLAFDHCSKLTSVTSLNEVPPTIQYGNWSGRYNITLYLPSEEAIERYKTSWSGFKDYQLIPRTTEQLQLTASPSGGEVTTGTKVYLSTTNVTGADIYYTLTGSTPSKSSTKYTSAGITINESCTLKAIAYKDGYEASDVLTAGYTVKQTPTDELYYYIGTRTGWNTSDTTYSFKKLSDGMTWELTMVDIGIGNDMFKIGTAATLLQGWDADVYGTEEGNEYSQNGTMSKINGPNFYPTYSSYTIRIVPSTMHYDILEYNQGEPTISVATCADVLSGADGTIYRVTGTVKQIVNTPYGNYWLSDNTGDIYIYGTRDKSGNNGRNNSIEAWGIEEGDQITVEGPRRNYQGLIELVDVTVVDLRKARKEGCLITTSSAGYATFYSSESTYTLPSGLSALVVTGASGGKLTYRSIADGSVSGVVPRGTAVMLTSDSKQAGSYTLTPTESTVSYSGTNLLHGSDEATTTIGDGYHYKLSFGPTGTKWDNVFGWYWGAQNGAPFQIEEHKAWLVVPRNNGTRAAGFTIEGDVLGVESLEKLSDSPSDLYFDLQGRRVSQPAQKGFYIKNGKKVVLK